VSAAFDFGGECWVGDAHCLHALLEAQCVERVDGEGSMAALRASKVADEPWAGAPGCVSEGGVDDLDELGILRGQAHDGKDTGWRWRGAVAEQSRVFSRVGRSIESTRGA
jgi:hypothetical protein